MTGQKEEGEGKARQRKSRGRRQGADKRANQKNLRCYSGALLFTPPSLRILWGVFKH